MRKISKYALLALGALLALVILIAAGVTARLAVGPISVAFLGPQLRESLSESLYYAYDVKFDDLRVHWSDGYGHTGLSLDGVRVADYSLQDIASVPEILIGVSVGDMIGGDMKPAAITVKTPKIRWIKTAGGAIKFDIGAKQPGESGKILEDFLITMAAAPEPEADSDTVLPEVRIVDADITIGNELDKTSVHVVGADILVAPHLEGVSSEFSLAIETAAEPVVLSAESLFRTADQRIELALTFADLSPNALSALLPGLGASSVLEQPITGSINLDMDKHFSIDAAVFDISGDALILAGEAHIDASQVVLEANGMVSEASLQALGEELQSGLGADFEAWMSLGSHSGGELALDVRGSVQRYNQTLDLSGTIGPPDTPFTVTGSVETPIVAIPAEL